MMVVIVLVFYCSQSLGRLPDFLVFVVVIVKYWTAGLTMHATDIYYTLLCPLGEIIPSKYQTVFRNIFTSPSPGISFKFSD